MPMVRVTGGGTEKFLAFGTGRQGSAASFMYDNGDGFQFSGFIDTSSEFTNSVLANVLYRSNYFTVTFKTDCIVKGHYYNTPINTTKTSGSTMVYDREEVLTLFVIEA